MDNNYEKVIQLDANKINLLFWYINNNTDLHHILYNGKPYYELSNMWSSDEIVNRPDYDQDINCDGYFECNATIPTICQTKNDVVEYVYSIENTLDILENINGEFNGELNETNRTFLENLVDIDYKKILITGYKIMMFTNSCGVNNDHRGSTHCRINLKFENKIRITEHITLHDLVQIYYRTKSHKFDKNYEMYCKCKVTKRKENYYINLIFDHGS